jgi:hypothetical protein
MFPYGSIPANSGVPYGQPYFPPTMGTTPFVYPYPVPVPQGSGPGRGRGRGRGYANTPRIRSLVPQVKEELRAATPGQLLELGRYVAATLSRTDPVLYGQFLAGLGRGTTTTPSIPSPDAQATRLIIADRKKVWKAACENDEDVKYWQSTVDALKDKHGANANVDTLILTDSKVDVRRYQTGKSRREALLAESGLAREGSGLIAILGGDTSSDAGTPRRSTSPIPTSTVHTTDESKREGKDTVSPELRELREITGALREFVRTANTSSPHSHSTSTATPMGMTYPPSAAMGGYMTGYPHGYQPWAMMSVPHGPLEEDEGSLPPLPSWPPYPQRVPRGKRTVTVNPTVATTTTSRDAVVAPLEPVLMDTGPRGSVTSQVIPPSSSPKAEGLTTVATAK